MEIFGAAPKFGISHKMSEPLTEFLKDQLPELDPILAERGVDLSKRPLQAATLIVEHCLVKIQGDTKDDYLSKPWFGLLLRDIERWYENRYGDTHEHQDSQLVTGVVSAYGTPFIAEVPLVVREAPRADGMCWICFPSEVLPDEDCMRWIVRPPNFRGDDEAERDVVSSSLNVVATSLRTAHVNLMTASHPDENTRALARGIIPHLEKAAIDIVSCRSASLSLAVWELNFACEKAIKTYLRGRNIRPPHTHDVHRLHQIAVSQTGAAKLASVAAMPKEKQVIKYRYSELIPPKISEALDLYRAALEVVVAYSHCLTRKLVFNNAKILLKRLPRFAGA